MMIRTGLAFPFQYELPSIHNWASLLDLKVTIGNPLWPSTGLGWRTQTRLAVDSTPHPLNVRSIF